MPKVWTDTLAGHKAAVRQAVIDAVASLSEEHGITGLTMSQIANEAGISRATLYKYFAAPEEVVLAWHAATVERHVALLRAALDESEPGQQLRTVLAAFAHLSRRSDGAVAAALHESPHLRAAEHHVRLLVAEAIEAAAAAGEVRTDVPAGELVDFCLAALKSASGCRSRAARDRLAVVTYDALRRH
jgi:AcrR family transcriptional regulator